MDTVEDEDLILIADRNQSHMDLNVCKCNLASGPSTESASGNPYYLERRNYKYRGKPNFVTVPCIAARKPTFL